MHKACFNILTSLTLFAVLLSLSFPQSAKAAYQVLVLQKAGDNSDTVWSDGLASKRFEQAIIFWKGHLVRLYTKNFSEHVSCPSGKFPFYYQVDKLLCQPIAGNDSKTLLGEDALSSAKDVLRDHQASCDGMKPMPYEPDTEDSYEKTKFNVLSLYGDLLGIEQITESFSYGRPQPMIAIDWSMYRLDKNAIAKVSPKILPSGLSAKAQAKFSHLAAKEKEPYSPAEFSHFVFRPQGPGMVVDFALPGTQDASRKSTKLVQVEKPDGLNKPSNSPNASFVISHPKLLNWPHLRVYDVAPDNSAVVYVLDGNLYWLTPGKAAIKLGEAGAVAGIQWFNATSAAELNALKHER